MPLSAANYILNQIYGQPHIKAPSDEGAVVFRRKMTEGEITKICYLLLLSFRHACGVPLIALLRCPDFVYAAWSAAQNRPLRQQMLPLSATGGSRICCPSEEGFILLAFSFDKSRNPSYINNNPTAAASHPLYTREAECAVSAIRKSWYFTQIELYIQWCRAVACCRRGN